MNIDSSVRGDKQVLNFHGHFDYSANRQFFRVINVALETKTTAEIEINLEGVHYIDSSACGMLLFLHNKAKLRGKSVALANATGAVKQTLAIMNFRKTFSVK